MAVFRFVDKVIENYKLKTISRIQNVKDLLLRGGIVALVAGVIIWIAIFLYVAFYYAYMPSISHSRPVFLQFRSCDEQKGLCSFPSAHVQLTRKQQLLMVGQPYRIHVNLEMPESPANKGLGMFMVCAEMHDKTGDIVASSCRSSMLHYKSRLLHVLKTLVFSPLMLFGTVEEKQMINIELFSDFEEDQNHPVTDIYVEIQSRHVEFYSATLSINAHFTGLRYLMFHWPILSAAIGITSNLFFIVLICTLSWWHLSHTDGEENSIFGIGKDTWYNSDNDKRDMFSFKGECDESSSEDVSFLQEGELTEKLTLESEYIELLGGTLDCTNGQSEC